MSIDRQKIAEAAQKFAAKNQFDKAIAEYQRILQVDAADVRTLLKVGDLQVRSGNNPGAVETYLAAGALYEQQGLHQKAIAVFKQVLQINPDQLPLYSRIADLHIKLGLPSDALQAMELLAQRYARLGDLDALASTFRQILLLDAQNLATRIRLGELLSKLNRGEEAASEFETACRVLESNGRIDEWARVAERLVFHRPNNLDALRKLASYYLERNDARRALPKIQAAYKSSPKDIATLDLLATAFRAVAQLPKTISVLKEMARIHAAEGRTRERNEVYQRVLELAPTDTEARDALRGGSKPGVRRPRSVPPPEPVKAEPAPGPLSDAPTTKPLPVAGPSSMPATELVEEVQDDVIEEVDDVVSDDPGDVVFALSQRPPKPSDTPPPVAAPPPAEPAVAPAAAPFIPRPPRAPTPSALAPPGATLRPTGQSTGGLRSPFVPQTGGTPAEPAAGEAARLLGEAEIFLKYGLRSKALAHIARAAELEPDSVDTITRVRDFYAALNEGAGVVRYSVRVAELVESSDAATAFAEVSRALEIDPEHAEARALYERLHGRQYADGGYDDAAATDDGSLIDEGDVVMAEDVPEPASPADYFEPGYDPPGAPAYAASNGYGDMGDATEIGESPLMGYDVVESRRYAYDEIPVEVESEHTVRGPSLHPGGRREIEEGLDEAEFFVTQGLYDDARATLQELLQAHPNHPLVMERLEEVEQLAVMQSSGYEASDPSYALADKIAEEVESLSPYEAAPAGQIDVETVLAQFKQGVGRTVSIEDCDTHYDLGIAYKEMGLLDDAIAEFKIATMNPARACIGETMIGLCYMEKGDISAALEHFKLGLQAHQRSEREELGLYYEMGNAYETVGDLSEALYFFQKVDKRDPSFRNVRARVVRLQGALHGVPEAHRGPAREDIDRSFDDLLKN